MTQRLDKDREVAVQARVRDGGFEVELAEPAKRGRIQTHFLGAAPYAPCDSETVIV